MKIKKLLKAFSLPPVRRRLRLWSKDDSKSPHIILCYRLFGIDWPFGGVITKQLRVMQNEVVSLDAALSSKKKDVEIEIKRLDTIIKNYGIYFDGVAIKDDMLVSVQNKLFGFDLTAGGVKVEDKEKAVKVEKFPTLTVVTQKPRQNNGGKGGNNNQNQQQR